MLIAQTDGLELLPTRSELIWGVTAAVLLVAPVLVVVALLVGARRAAGRHQDLEARVQRLEEYVLEERAPTRCTHRIHPLSTELPNAADLRCAPGTASRRERTPLGQGLLRRTRLSTDPERPPSRCVVVDGSGLLAGRAPSLRVLDNEV